MCSLSHQHAFSVSTSVQKCQAFISHCTTPSLITTPFSFSPSIREELVMFSGVAEDWMKSIRTQHLLSSAWTLRQEGSDHPNVNHTLAKWAWVLFLWSICTILSVREPVLFYSSSPCYQKFIFQKEKPNQMYRALGVGYKNVFRHLKKKSMYLFDFIPCIKSTF